MNGLGRPDTEQGFTLVELLMAITILGIIIGPLAAAMFAGLHNADRTAKILVSSADRQLLAAYFPPDVISSSSANTAVGSWGCAGTAPAGTDSVVQLTWQEFNAAGPTPTTTTITSFVADYRVTQSGTEWQLTRYTCLGGGSPLVLVVAHHIQAKTAATAAVSGPTVAITLTDQLGTPYTVSASRRSP